ncbi:uncharacterized protein I206_102223 [Kwoniella pini CBS 10737]|uniref:Uncharacterized protein n=1 Tax=Kwoniella pini CBS 10737 TaxID=1296096 RepID=A0A1B9HSW4_9TREE|nr:uncharacterized protein I206_07591 [Kwoniella pini CBS 10737]OCF46358.1 hypothetical protein I206_07591 [Kwoniella pini CBS 10737]
MEPADEPADDAIHIKIFSPRKTGSVNTTHITFPRATHSIMEETIEERLRESIGSYLQESTERAVEAREKDYSTANSPCVDDIQQDVTSSHYPPAGFALTSPPEVADLHSGLTNSKPINSGNDSGTILDSSW